MAIKYSLNDTQVKHLAIICYREQGSNDAGVRACASHMCNYYEKYQKNNFKDVYECTFGSGWYWEKARNEEWIKNHPSVPASVVNAVKDVIVNGNRTLPEYVDEYDCLTDVRTATNNGKSFNPEDRTQYIKDVTKIVNVYGSTYTFYCFPDGASGYCDAFGYISKPKEASTTATIPDKACSWAESIAADQSHGYSQANRWGPDYDCSSLVISAYKQAGLAIDTSKVYYTGNMDGLKSYGFKDVSASCNLNTGSGLQRGDILYYHISGTNGHTAMYCGNGKIVHARGQSYGSSATGDQGTEIAVTTYSRSQWQYVLRYQGTAATTTTTVKAATSFQIKGVKKGSNNNSVLLLQAILTAMGYCGADGQPLEIDGDFGANTDYALKAYQKAVGFTVNGVAGPAVWTKLKNNLVLPS